jgi:hypothetical protein
MSGVSHMKGFVQVFMHAWVSVEIVVYVHGLQWEQSRTYMGCSGNNHVHTRVAVGIVV